MATKRDSIRRAKAAAQESRIKRITEHFETNGDFSFAVEGLPAHPWPDRICDELCKVMMAGDSIELTISDMLALHESAACACGLEGCLSRDGQGPKRDLGCNAEIAGEALEFLISKAVVR